jgi:hypothetical protein
MILCDSAAQAGPRGCPHSARGSLIGPRRIEAKWGNILRCNQAALLPRAADSATATARPHMGLDLCLVPAVRWNWWPIPRSLDSGLEWTCTSSQVVEADAVRSFGSRIKGAGLLFHSGFARDFGNLMCRNRIANLAQDVEVAAGWKHFELHPCHAAVANKTTFL